MKILLNEIMVKRNYAYRQLEIITGIPIATLHRIANQKTCPNMIQMEKIAKGLKISIEDLYISEYKKSVS